MINDVAFSKITGLTGSVTNEMINSVDFSKITNFSYNSNNALIGNGLMFSSSTASNTPYNWISPNFHTYLAITPKIDGIKAGQTENQKKFALNSGLFFCTPNYYNTANNGDNSTFQTILIAPSNNVSTNNNGVGNSNMLQQGYAIGSTYNDI